MATQTLRMRIQLRRATTAEWTANKDVVPAAGEPCFDVELNTLKIGDGAKTYEQLEPIGGTGTVEVSADGTSIVLDDGVFKLAGFDAAETGAQPRKKADGTLEWVVPSTETVEGLQTTVAGLQSDVTNLQTDVSAVKEILTPSGEGSSTLLERVEGLEGKVGDGSVDDKITAAINKFATDVSDDGVVNSYKELIDYVAKHGDKAANMAADITVLQGLVGNKSVSDQINEAVSSKVGAVPDNKTVVQMITDAQTAATYDDAAVKADIKKNKEDIAAVSALVGDTAVASQISTAVADAKTELKGSTSDTDASATIAGAKKYADKLDTAMDARVDALESAVGEGGSVAAQITAEIAKLDKADKAVAGKYVSAVSEEDGVITVVRADLPDYTNTYAAKEHNHAIADVIGLQTALGDKANATDVNTLSGKVSTLIGEDTDKSIRTIANEELAAQLIPEGAKDSLDTLQEIAAWIQKHPDDASAMSAAISALEEKVGDKTVSAQITEAINALKAGDIKNAVDRIAALETDTHTHANKALLDTYTQTEVNLADAVAKKHSHANAAELDKFADGDKAKLDTAVQSITAGTGLKATKTGTDVAVDIDDTVVFIFDCGDSTTV